MGESMFKEFKEFLMKGNLVEIAVAFVMGAAFSRVVGTLTSRVVSPLIAKVFGLPDLDSLWTFGDVVDGVAAGSFGALLAAIIDFVIVAFVMFLVVKAYNKAQAAKAEQAEEEADPGPSEDIVLLTEIRDALHK
jgi:large conductance mechanosensitive channel